MEPPRPAPEHARLAFFAGTWSVVEKLLPSPWDPHGGTADATLTARVALDGFGVLQDYEQRRDGRVSYRGHGVFTWEPREGCYLMYWFDTLGRPPAAPAKGRFEGERLVFEQPSPLGHARYVYEPVRDGEFNFRIEHSRDRRQWQPFVEARYVRR